MGKVCLDFGHDKVEQMSSYDAPGLVGKALFVSLQTPFMLAVFYRPFPDAARANSSTYSSSRHKSSWRG